MISSLALVPSLYTGLRLKRVAKPKRRRQTLTAPQGVFIRWTGMDYWTTGMDYWTTGMDYWNTGMDYWNCYLSHKMLVKGGGGGSTASCAY